MRQTCFVYLMALTQLFRLCSTEREISVIMTSEMVNYARESAVTNTSHGISVRIQRRSI
jgi:hypothetical protein